MGIRCVVCQVTTPRHIVHRFPSQEAQKRQWLEACSVTEAQTFSGVCEAHFSSENYWARTEKRKRLKKDAVPTKNLPATSGTAAAASNATSEVWRLVRLARDATEASTEQQQRAAGLPEPCCVCRCHQPDTNGAPSQHRPQLVTSTPIQSSAPKDADVTWTPAVETATPGSAIEMQRTPALHVDLLMKKEAMKTETEKTGMKVICDKQNYDRRIILSQAVFDRLRSFVLEEHLATWSDGVNLLLERCGMPPSQDSPAGLPGERPTGLSPAGGAQTATPRSSCFTTPREEGCHLLYQTTSDLPGTALGASTAYSTPEELDVKPDVSTIIIKEEPQEIETQPEEIDEDVQEPVAKPSSSPEKVWRKLHKYCIVPLCTNSTRTSPSKIFVTLPIDLEKRKAWCRAARRTDADHPPTGWYLFVCEDHFNLESDAENYMRYKMQPGIKLRMKPGVIPHKFDCQPSTFLTEVRAPRCQVVKRRKTVKTVNGRSGD